MGMFPTSEYVRACINLQIRYLSSSITLVPMLTYSSAQLSCLCGAVKAPGSLLTAQIPISEELCHCSVCRQTTGSLAVSFARLRTSQPEAVSRNLTAYPSSKIVTRYFCSSCGCHCFLQDHERREWYCLSGVIELDSDSKGDRPKDVIKISDHDYVSDTLDGGLAPAFLDLAGHSIPTWSEAPQQSPEQDSFDLEHKTVLNLAREAGRNCPPLEDESLLTAKCHCGGVSLLIKRVNNTSSRTRYTPNDPTKYLTYLCACRSCRLTTGVSLVPWALVPAANVFNAAAFSDSNDSSSTSTQKKLVPLEFGNAAVGVDSNPGLTVKHYWSSPNVCRSFCSKCGATVSYWNVQRPDELDLAVGILRSQDGSMARRWLEWDWGRCSFSEECIDQELCEAWRRCAPSMRKLEE